MYQQYMLFAYQQHLPYQSMIVELIYERHRHRYEVNNRYRNDLEASGLRLSGVSPDEHLVEVVELPGHPFFLASQFHPEFKSRPDDPHPMFLGFIAAAIAHRRELRTTEAMVKEPAAAELP